MTGIPLISFVEPLNVDKCILMIYFYFINVCIVNASHSFPQVVGLLLWLVELCETQNRFNVMDTLYPTILDPDEIEDEDYEQTVEFKVLTTI